MADLLEQAVGDGGVVPLLGYADAQLGVEWQRKSGLESRALAGVTANVALVTLFFGIANQTSLLRHLAIGAAHGVLLWTLAPIGLSVLAFALAAVPGNYPAPDAAALFRLRVGLRGRTGDDVRDELLEARIEEVRLAGASNSKKARFVVVGFWLVAIAAMCLITAVILAF